MDNMRYYEQARAVPQDALKPFSNGRFSGTDINPMWRIKKLTEMFGPCGIGWYTEVTRQEVVPAGEGNQMVFVDLNLYVKEGGEWSKPIFGTGGNTLQAKGKGDDEGYKKAYTDAMSIACKALGIGADVWYANDTTSKYADKYIDRDGETPISRGSAAAAQAAGQAKLQSVMAQIMAEAQDDKSRPATEEQKQTIRARSTQKQVEWCNTKYGGEGWPNMTVNAAYEIISKLDKKAGGAA